jgi:hypothetical protein
MDVIQQAELQAFVSLSDATLLLRMNRERVLRRLQDGRLDGQQVAGRWFVSRNSIERLRGGHTADAAA